MKYVAPVVVLFLSATACTPSLRRAGEEPSYFPMTADRVWEYRLRKLPSDEIWPVVIHSRGAKFVPALGRTAVIFDEQYPDQVVPVAFFLSEGFLQSEIGLRYRLERGMELMPIGTQPMRIMPVPPRVGMSWAYFEQVFGATTDDAGFEIRWNGSIARAESVTVPAGVFRDCLRVESIALHRLPMDTHPHEYRYLDWYAPNIGLVKSEYASGEDGEIFTRMELVSFARGTRPSEPAPAPPLDGQQWATRDLGGFGS